MAGISFVGLFLLVDFLGLGCVGSLLNTRVEKVMAVLPWGLWRFWCLLFPWEIWMFAVVAAI